MSYRFFLTITLALIVAFAIGACAENPADDVPAAEVSDVDNGEMADESAADTESEDMSDESEADEADEAAAEDETGDEAAASGDDAAAMPGGTIDLDGTIAVTGSKVTGSHYIVFEDWTGTLDLGDGTPESAQLMFEVQVGSLVADPENRGAMTDRLETHLQSGDFFLVEEHPTATFVSTSIVEGGADGATHTITGDLTLRGITKEISFPATVETTDDSVTATAEFSLNRLDFDVAFAGQPDDLIREEVVMQIQLEGTL